MGGAGLHAPCGRKLLSAGQATGWRCQACVLQVRKNQDHLSVCQGYSDLRQDLDLENDYNLVEFFRQIMARRERHGWD